MKRSEINSAISRAKQMLDKYSWTLPIWGYWTQKEYDQNPEIKKYCKEH